MTDFGTRATEGALEEQAAALDLVMGQHPTQLTLAEIVLDLAAGPDFADRDAVEEAVDELVRAGVGRRQVDAVVPTRPTLRLRELSARWP